MPENILTLDKIMNLHINFHKLAHTQGNCYNELSEWRVKKKTAINPKSNNEGRFKWGVMLIILRELANHSVTKINATGKDFNFH